MSTKLSGIETPLRKLSDFKWDAAPQKLWYASQPTEGLDWRIRAMRMVDSVVSDAVNYAVDKIPLSRIILVVETPNNWTDERGQVSKDAEDVQKLYWFVGALISAFSTTNSEDMYICDIYTAIPRAWKGQTPKNIMVKRAKAHLEKWGKDYPTPLKDDVAEAVLLGQRFAEIVLPSSTLPPGWAKVWSHLEGGSGVRLESW